MRGAYSIPAGTARINDSVVAASCTRRECAVYGETGGNKQGPRQNAGIRVVDDLIAQRIATCDSLVWSFMKATCSSRLSSCNSANCCLVVGVSDRTE